MPNNDDNDEVHNLHLTEHMDALRLSGNRIMHDMLVYGSSSYQITLPGGLNVIEYQQPVLTLEPGRLIPVDSYGSQIRRIDDAIQRHANDLGDQVDSLFYSSPVSPEFYQTVVLDAVHGISFKPPVDPITKAKDLLKELEKIHA